MLSLVHAIGIDIGGTKIAGALVNDEGEILLEERRPTPAGDAGAIVDTVVEMIGRLSLGREVAAAGVAAAGFIDELIAPSETRARVAGAFRSLQEPA